MISIFSNYLDPVREKFALQKSNKPSIIYNQLRIAYNQGAKGIIDSIRMISVGNDDDDYDIFLESTRNEDFKHWINWVNTKITLTLGIDDYRATDVRIRIATNMLNKLVYDDKLSRKIALKVHFNLIDNLRNERSAISIEDLPF
jgi:hypothetical protein